VVKETATVGPNCGFGKVGPYPFDMITQRQAALDGRREINLHFLRVSFLNIHVFKLAGFEYLTALEAFHEFRVFVTGDDLDAWVAARLFYGLILRFRGKIVSHRIHTEEPLGPKPIP
jgi:hypothetical protein